MRQGLQRTAIEGLVVEMHVGIRDWERDPAKTQRVALDVAVYRAEFGQERDIADCYDYSALHRFLSGFAERGHVDLIETILADILDHCFQDPSVAAAAAKVAKLDVYNGRGAPSVAADVTREEWAARRGT